MKRFLHVLPACALTAALLAVAANAAEGNFGLFTIEFNDEDHFADGLTIPEGIDISEPAPECRRPPGDPGSDPYFAAVAAAMAQPGNDDPTITAEVPSLARLASEHRDLLLRYLCAHPAWRVSKEHGSLRADRMMLACGEWSGKSNDHDMSGIRERWVSYLAVDFHDPRKRRSAPADRFAPGETRGAWLEKGGIGRLEEDLHSHISIDLGTAVLEIGETTCVPERRITKALLRLVEDELRPLAESPTEETLRVLLPPGAVTRGEPDIALRDDCYGHGIYGLSVRANPGEPGVAWLKAFEVTTGAPLSVSRLADASSMRLGWSSDPAELFSGTARFTIYEGNWGQYYAARFELWFRPDSGAPGRKLAERTFKIQGWMR